jgi:proline iminopeptidase
MSENYIISHGAKLWSYTEGKGMPVLLCLGGPGCSDYLGPVAEMISGVSQPIRYEQRGCGRSDRIPPYDIDTELRDIEAIRVYYGIDRWIVGGHSWGANLALAYAMAHRQNVLGLIYLSGPGIQHDIDWGAAKEKGRQERGEDRPAESLEWDEEVQKQLRESWYDFIKIPELWKKISQLDIPALFVHGRQDIRPIWPVLQLANMMPNARIEIMDGEHFIWLIQADELGRVLRGFIKSILQ